MGWCSTGGGKWPCCAIAVMKERWWWFGGVSDGGSSKLVVMVAAGGHGCRCVFFLFPFSFSHFLYFSQGKERELWVLVWEQNTHTRVFIG